MQAVCLVDKERVECLSVPEPSLRAGEALITCLSARAWTTRSGRWAQIAAPGAKCMVVGTNPAGHVRLEGSSARRKGLTFFMVRRSRLTLKRAITLSLQGRVPLARLGTHTFPATECQQAFETARHYRHGVVKAFIRM